MCSIEVNTFSNVSIPDTSNIQYSVRSAIIEFHLISFESVDDELVTGCIAQILKEGEKFRNVTTKSISESTIMSQHCGEIITHVEFLTQNHVKGKVFLEILEDILSWAQKCKNESEAIETEYRNIRGRLNTILKKLQTRNENVDEEIKKKTDSAIKAKEEGKSFRNEAISSIAILVPAMASTISVAVIPGAQHALSATVPITTAAGKNAINKWRKRGDCYNLARSLKSEVLKLEAVAYKINEIIKVTQQIISTFNELQIFWQKQVDEVSGLISRFNHTMNGNLYYNEMKGRAVINNWKK
ncbi:17864_t:CDS:1, partial [Gigaspora rosea]